jgi:hypothetical protein
MLRHTETVVEVDLLLISDGSPRGSRNRVGWYLPILKISEFNLKSELKKTIFLGLGMRKFQCSVFFSCAEALMHEHICVDSSNQ